MRLFMGMGIPSRGWDPLGTTPRHSCWGSVRLHGARSLFCRATAATSFRSWLFGTTSNALRPAKAGQHGATAPEDNALLLEPDPLRQHARCARPTADAARRIDDAMPRDALVHLAQRLSHLTRRARASEERGELTVGGDPAPGNAAHQLEHGGAEDHAGAAPD